MGILKSLEAKYSVNPDRREVAQSYLRIGIFILCLLYVFFIHNTPYIQFLTCVALVMTIFWIVMAYRRIGDDDTRRVLALAYDCLILGLVMVGLGTKFVGLTAVLLYVSIGYGLRYRSPRYLKLGMLFTLTVFLAAAMIRGVTDWMVFISMFATLVFVPLALLSPTSRMIELLDNLNEANHALDDANKTKARFISNVSHDLLTPVSAIIGYSMHNPPSIDGIRINAFQLTRQIKAMLGVARDDEPMYDEHHEAFRPIGLLRQVNTICKPLAESRGITIEILSSKDSEPLTGPVHSMLLCLMNVVNNAARHSDGTRVTLDYRLSNDDIEFEIADDGVGIPAAQQALVFDRFHRLESSKMVEGLGLGLAIVKDTVVRLGGDVGLESSTNGTTFRLRIPIQRRVGQVPSSSSQAQIRPKTAPGATRVLFVDDDFQSLNAWSGVLSEAGFIVFNATGGQQAIAAVEAGNRFDVCIIDYRMPDIDGITVSQRIRGADPHPGVIMITADTVDPKHGLFRDALDAGTLDHIVRKPLHPATLMAAIEQVQSARQLERSVA